MNIFITDKRECTQTLTSTTKSFITGNFANNTQSQSNVLQIISGEGKTGTYKKSLEKIFGFGTHEGSLDQAQDPLSVKNSLIKFFNDFKSQRNLVIDFYNTKQLELVPKNT